MESDSLLGSLTSGKVEIFFEPVGFNTRGARGPEGTSENTREDEDSYKTIFVIIWGQIIFRFAFL